ncbi:MAG: hypothetical protein OI74_04290 [Gammaproteobacteria bacterium (ex Lamellibrachia satsuma)]|nr:MAG: hypothetical protein HPY30_14920 [Gammaproteobacteria bacterium (ex Lamellibrachia satsuma)]RRS34825.1 MAG: hypothetical protein OI74_04290 [Gammaproteobacteria bacterium (ex Lamellibrachia satsuma)]RRS35796.1 MAG: hypothetical protein NV67_09550 [Gammaproteobacteria bacterium (ex Lamellibrachia satsuma)]
MLKINNKGLQAWRTASLVLVVVFGILTILGSGDSVQDLFDPYAIADAGPDQHVRTWSTVHLDGSGSNTPLGADPGANSAVYSWEMIKKPAEAQFWMSATNVLNPTFLASYPGEYIAQLTVKHNGHTGLDNVTITAYAESNEIRPTANAGADIVAKHGALVELDGSRSFDRYISKSLIYTWFMTERPLDSNSALSSRDVVNPTFIAEFNENDGRKSHYEIRLHVIDEDDWVATPDHVDVYVYPSEGYAHPTPIAGPEQRVSTGTQVNLDGSESHDVDGRPLTYAWQFYSRPLGSHAVLSGANTSMPSFTPDVDGLYVLFLSVDNGERNSSSDLIGVFNQSLYDRKNQDRVKVTATSDTPEPVSLLGPDQQIFYAGPDSQILDASRSIPVSGITGYGWGLINKPATSNATVVTSDPLDPNGAQLNYDMEGDYVVGVVALNIHQLDYDTIVYKVTTNTPPVADAGTDQNVTANFPVTLNGSNSSDTDLDPVAYSWSLVSTPVDWTSWPGAWPLLSEGREASPTFTPTVNGNYILRLTVNDNQVSSDSDSVTVTVSGSMINSPPVADAGPDQPDAVTGVQVTLDGSGSSDPDTDPITFLWHFESVPLLSMMSDASLATPTLEQPVFTPDVEGVYQLSLVVNDGQLDSTADTVNITATDPGGVCSNPLTLQTALPYLPGLGEMPSIIQIDASGIDTIRVVTTTDPSAFLDVSALQAFIPDQNQISEANFITINGNWTIFSRTHDNPVSDTVSPSFILERQSDNIFFKVDVAFTGSDALAEVQIDSLTACRCGADAGDCP